MNRHVASIRRCALGLGLCAGVCLGRAAADSPIDPRVLLLHNGRLIEGRIERMGDRYKVHQDGTEIQIKVGDVAVAAADRHECYLRQTTTIDPGQAEGHLQLALWCLKYGLQGEAQSELDAARSVEPLHPKIALVERRLKLAAAPAELRPPRTLPAAASQPRPTDDAKTAADRDPAKPVSPSRLRADELDRFVRTLPEGVVGQFTNRVQPVLVNHCALAGCHGPGSQSSYVLDRVSDRRTANRRSTQRNLYATLQQVDVESPAESKLLTAPLRAHGTAKGPIFSGRQSAQYEQLVWWAQRASGHLSPVVAKKKPAFGTGPQPGPIAAGQRDAERPRRAKAERDDASPDDSSRVVPASASESESRLADPPFDGRPRETDDPPDKGAFSPRDPFDPEIFNRRVLGK